MNFLLNGSQFVFKLFLIGTLNLYSPGYPVPPICNFVLAGAAVLAPEEIDGPWIETEMYLSVVSNFDIVSLFLWSFAEQPQFIHTVGLRVTEHKHRLRWMLYWGSKRIA